MAPRQCECVSSTTELVRSKSESIGFRVRQSIVARIGTKLSAMRVRSTRTPEQIESRMFATARNTRQYLTFASRLFRVLDQKAADQKKFLEQQQPQQPRPLPINTIGDAIKQPISSDSDDSNDGHDRVHLQWMASDCVSGAEDTVRKLRVYTIVELHHLLVTLFGIQWRTLPAILESIVWSYATTTTTTTSRNQTINTNNTNTTTMDCYRNIRDTVLGVLHHYCGTHQLPALSSTPPPPSTSMLPDATTVVEEYPVSQSPPDANQWDGTRGAMLATIKRSIDLFAEYIPEGKIDTNTAAVTAKAEHQERLLYDACRTSTDHSMYVRAVVQCATLVVECRLVQLFHRIAADLNDSRWVGYKESFRFGRRPTNTTVDDVRPQTLY